MNDLRHMIHRQLFELTARTGQPAWEWDRTTADFHRDLLLPVLEACFREADKSGEHLVIDRLEVDLGVFGGKEAFRKEAGDRLRERLVQGLRVKREEASAQGDLVATGKSSTRSSGNKHPFSSVNSSSNGEKNTINDPRRELPPALMDGKEAPLGVPLFPGRRPVAVVVRNRRERCFWKMVPATINGIGYTENPARGGRWQCVGRCNFHPR